MPADSPLDSVKKSLVDADVLTREVDAVEDDLRMLKVAWEQFFLGIERRPPTKQFEEFKKRMARLKNQFTRVTGLKFRINTLHQKYLSYERLWARTQAEMEAGTYKRDLFKARMHARKTEFEGKARDERLGKKKDDSFDITEDLGDMGLDDELDQAAQAAAKPKPPAPVKQMAPVAAVAPLIPGIKPVMAAIPPVAKPAVAAQPAARPIAAAAAAAPRPAAPAAVRAPGPASAGSGDNMSDAKVKAIYDAYVTAKRRCAEDTSKITLESVSATLKKQVPELMKKHNAKGVDFKVVIKDGKALLRAVPKE